jgi:Escherichia/Staphylococcus phage prohead protease
MRTIVHINAELRAQLDGNTLHGHAAVFDTRASVPGGWEQLSRTAFDKALASEETDVRAFVNHDHSKLLGRQSAGTLRLDVDDEGLAFEVDLPDTSYAHDLRELVARGDLNGASFGFIPGDDTWGRAADGRQLRTHTSVAELIDVSAVTFPAYAGAGVALRHAARQGNRRSELIKARHRLIA